MLSVIYRWLIFLSCLLFVFFGRNIILNNGDPLTCGGNGFYKSSSSDTLIILFSSGQPPLDLLSLVDDVEKWTLFLGHSRKGGSRQDGGTTEGYERLLEARINHWIPPYRGSLV